MGGHVGRSEELTGSRGDEVKSEKDSSQNLSKTGSDIIAGLCSHTLSVLSEGIMVLLWKRPHPEGELTLNTEKQK